MAKYIALVFLILSSIVSCFITFARLIRLFFSRIGSSSKNFRKFPDVPDSEKSFSTEFSSVGNETFFSCNDLHSTTVDQEIISLKKVQFQTHPIPVATSTPLEYCNQNPANKKFFSIPPINRKLNISTSDLIQSLEPSSEKHESDIIGVGPIKDNTNRNPSKQKNKTYLSSADEKHLGSDVNKTMLSKSIHPKSQTTNTLKSSERYVNSSVQFLRSYRRTKEAQLSNLRSNKKKLTSSRPIIAKSLPKDALKSTDNKQNTSFMQFLRNNRGLQEAQRVKELRLSREAQSAQEPQEAQRVKELRLSREAQSAQEPQEARILNLRSGKKLIMPSKSSLPKSSSSNA